MTTIGPYVIESELGRGGMGAVLRARAPGGGSVAVKMLLRPDAHAVARFERERRLLQLLGEAEGFVPLLDFGETPQGPYYVMPLVPGGTLRAQLADGPLWVEETVALGIALATALGHAHEKGIVHRDLKPENVLFDAQGKPLIADLGIAKHFRADVSGASQSIALTRGGEVTGTAGYMAPEQLDGKEVGAAADVFALGAMLYECLTGEPPFTGDSIHEVLAKVASSDARPVRELRPDAPRWLVGVVAKAMRRDASARFRDGAELARALAEGPRQRTRRLVVRGGAAALVVATLAGAIAVATRASPEPRLPAAGATSSLAPAPPSPPRTEPDWWSGLPVEDRAPLPLPKGISFGAAPGEYVNAKDRSVLVYVPACTFEMGMPRNANLMVHAVELSPYFIAKYELTNRQWDLFAAETHYVTTAEHAGNGYVQPVKVPDTLMEGDLTMGATRFHPDGDESSPVPAGEHPVVQVSWGDAVAYCKWAGLRLPTEAEWERAAAWDARAKKAHRYPWGDELLRPLANVADQRAALRWPGRVEAAPFDDGWATTAPVGSFPRGASAIGALDMCGNVLEWVQDGYDGDYYHRSPRKDPLCPRGEEGSFQVCRGGSWRSMPEWANSARRHHFVPLYRSNELGFRVGRDARDAR